MFSCCISSRFTIVIHILACIDMFKDDYKVTSDFLAGSVNVNPVVIRRLLQQLKAAGYFCVKFDVTIDITTGGWYNLVVIDIVTTKPDNFTGLANL